MQKSQVRDTSEMEIRLWNMCFGWFGLPGGHSPLKKSFDI